MKNNLLMNEDAQSKKVLELLSNNDIAVDKNIDPSQKNKQ